MSSTIARACAGARTLTPARVVRRLPACLSVAVFTYIKVLDGGRAPTEVQAHPRVDRPSRVVPPQNWRRRRRRAHVGRRFAAVSLMRRCMCFAAGSERCIHHADNVGIEDAMNRSRPRRDRGHGNRGGDGRGRRNQITKTQFSDRDIEPIISSPVCTCCHLEGLDRWSWTPPPPSPTGRGCRVIIFTASIRCPGVRSKGFQPSSD